MSYVHEQGLMTVTPSQQQIHFVGYSDLTHSANNSVPSSLITYSFSKKTFLPSVPINTPVGEYVRLLPRA